MMTPNHALPVLRSPALSGTEGGQRTRREGRGCPTCVPCAGSPKLGALDQPMKTALSFLMLMCALVLIGCRGTRVDISGVSREAELDRYVGKTIVFTGRYMPTKQLTISNGKVSIEVYRTGSFQIDRDSTVMGVLKKEVIAPRPQQDQPVQLIPSGTHYFIQ